MTIDMHAREHRPRVRDTGIRLGRLEPGPSNAITDVSGVKVGQTTLIEGNGPLIPGSGPIRTGVTVVVPHQGNVFREKVPAAVHVINGLGKCMGQEQIEEVGNIESPIALTGTLNIGRVADALISHAIRENPDIGITTSTINPVVGECSDAFLNDIQGRHISEEHVLSAIDSASSGPVDEGAVGAGTGMSAFGYKGGIGTASRVTPPQTGGWTVGVLVLANFGIRNWLTVDGVPVGAMLDADGESPPECGSIMFIVATDAPLLDRGLRRLARRCAIGLGRTGSLSGHHSGDYVIAFSTAESVRIPQEPTPIIVNVDLLLDTSPVIDALFQAVIEATEEAILNALFKATTVVGRDGNRRDALPLDQVLSIMRAAGRLLE